MIVLFLFVSTFSLGKMYAMSSSIAKPEGYRQVSQIIQQNRVPDDAVVYHGGTCGNQTWKFYDPGGTIFGNPDYDPHNFTLSPIVSAAEIFSEELFAVTMDTPLAGHPAICMVVSNYNPQKVLPLVQKWHEQYAIETVYTDQYLLLLKITRLIVDPIMNLNNSDTQ